MAGLELMRPPEAWTLWRLPERDGLALLAMALLLLLPLPLPLPLPSADTTVEVSAVWVKLRDCCNG